MEESYIIGLDVSTTTIGICIYNKTCNNINMVSHLTPKVSKSITTKDVLFLKAKQFEEWLDTLSANIVKNTVSIVIEEPLLRSNNVNTVSTLLRFNGMISLYCYQKFGITPNYISSYDARAYGFPELMAIRKFNKKGELLSEKIRQKYIKDDKKVLFGEYPFDIDKKYVIWNKVSEKFPEIEWVYNKKGEMKKESFDASDAVCCVLGYINKTKLEMQD